MHTIDRAILADATTMLDLQQRAFAEEGRRCGTEEIPPLTEPLAAIVEHVQSQTALVARLDGRLIGAIRGVRTGGVCTLRALVVDPSCQGRGVGSSLLRALERAHPDAARFDLTTNTLMEGNVPFYERHGYRVVAFTRHGDRITLAQMCKEVAGFAPGMPGILST
jgi:GNAT superfamily N-acetyltransferase